MNDKAEIRWVGMPRRSEYEEGMYHRKEIWVDFQLIGDPNTYTFEAQNILFESGIRNIYFDVMKMIVEDDKLPYLQDIDYQFLNETTPLIDQLPHHPHVKLFFQWLCINKEQKLKYVH